MRLRRAQRHAYDTDVVYIDRDLCKRHEVARQSAGMDINFTCIHIHNTQAFDSIMNPKLCFLRILDDGANVSLMRAENSALRSGPFQPAPVTKILSHHSEGQGRSPLEFVLDPPRRFGSMRTTVL